MTITMFDSVDLQQFPANPQAVAGYTSGMWPTYPQLLIRFPHSYHLSIAVGATHQARCLDVEPGDATPAQAPGWFRNYADRSQGLPVLYGSASNVGAIIAAMKNAGIGRDQYYIWSAHYTFREHICAPGICGYPKADATQWTDKALGRNLDQSACADYFFAPGPGPGPGPSPTPPSEEDIVAITSSVAANGTMHVFYEHKDGSLWYTYQPKDSSSWSGGKPGESVAGLKHFAPAPK